MDKGLDLAKPEKGKGLDLAKPIPNEFSGKEQLSLEQIQLFFHTLR